MPYAMVPAFYARLGALGTVDARALQWTILTGARASEAIGGEAKAPATWGEITKIDGQFTWVIDGSRMKGKQAPQSAQAGGDQCEWWEVALSLPPDTRPPSKFGEWQQPPQPLRPDAPAWLSQV